ncbi:MAG: efflux RND transporter periplasmic adaptor subunit [Chloroflexi bacterium]|nr:efflux RND transporter periplasmic adaptor subunit [Chloroflexota bacterium]
MHPNPRRILPVILLLVAIAAVWWYFGVRTQAPSGEIPASGTVEATQVNISPELAGRVLAVRVQEGQAVRAGEALVQFDTGLLEAQRAQAAAGLAAATAAHEAAGAAARAAQSAAEAAAANFALLKAGPSAEQLAVAQTVVDRARLARDALQEQYDDLPEAARDTQDGKALKAQLDQAQAALANAQAQFDLAAAGARPEQLDAARAGMQAAQAQAEAARAQVQAARGQAQAAQAALAVLEVQIGKLTLVSPVDGVVLSRAIEPGEVASPGATLLVIGQLADLSITVYVSEDRYGEIHLGQTAAVTVDSFPGQRFSATVAHIADHFEFTPRNVQTAEGRKSTVFAVRLSITDPGGKLKPGMPADVTFEP